MFCQKKKNLISHYGTLRKRKRHMYCKELSEFHSRIPYTYMLVQGHVIMDRCFPAQNYIYLMSSYPAFSIKMYASCTNVRADPPHFKKFEEKDFTKPLSSRCRLQQPSVDMKF
uniref:Uncharacterized protein n=1 Tax=Sphaerodactylus townsendi TaxID=933632 RepID=A0ACB8ELV7_9SAUR